MFLNNKKDKHVSSKATGFTLVEILVALSIIAILASLLLPVFSIVRNKSQMISCASNLHQLYSAFALYTADHESFLPPYPGHGATSYEHSNSASPCFQVGDKLVSSMFPYSRSMSVWLCPSDQTDHPFELASCGLPSPNKTSYYYEAFPSGSTELRFKLLDFSHRFFHASNTPLLSDCINDSDSRVYEEYNHRGRKNYLFFDGHIKSLTEFRIES